MKLTKATFRKRCLQENRKNALHGKIYKDFIVNKILKKELKELLGNKRGKKILFFYPLPNEADIRKTLYYFRKKEQIFLPFMVGKSFKMVPFRLPLKRKKFGIFEAGNSLKTIRKIDIAIVPVVGIDGNLQRLGFGKGMYDRFFPTLKKRPFTIFVQLQACTTQAEICDKYDIKADDYISYNRVIQQRTRHKRRV
jgi:5-formyltetrahydrofolate cyclo-ligase